MTDEIARLVELSERADKGDHWDYWKFVSALVAWFRAHQEELKEGLK